jgi:transcriptional regulator with XRE-family HTH domain
MLLRRIRRTADLSQRELARTLGVSNGAVAQVETGERDAPATLLLRAAAVAGLRLALLDAGGTELPGMDPDAVRDRAGRHFPAHLDTRYGDDDWWHADWYRSRRQPWYTFDRHRDGRDSRRQRGGIPPDHQLPLPGDAPAERARVRAEADRAARHAQWRWQRVEAHLRRIEEHELHGWDTEPDFVCTCPPACTDLLFPTEPQPPSLAAVPHVPDCPCRCDLA